MSIEITMPRLSDTMEQGTIIKWNAKEGDAVSAGDAVADIETDKATMEMQVYDDGTIAKILVDEGSTVEVGTVIAIMAEEDEDVSEIAGTTNAQPVAQSQEASAETSSGQAAPTETPVRRVMPAAQEQVTPAAPPQQTIAPDADGAAEWSAA